MISKGNPSGGDLFIVDNSDGDWKVLRYLHDWCQLSKRMDVATGYFEIGALLGLKDEWQKIDQIRLLMGDEVSQRTQRAFQDALGHVVSKLDNSLESEKEGNDFLAGVPAIVAAIRDGKIQCRVYRPRKFHAKAYITHARLDVVGSSALVGSSNFTLPGLTQNVELNVQITGRPVKSLQEWFDGHWEKAEDVTPEVLRTIERHTRDYTPFEVYARSLQEYFRSHEMTADEWEQKKSRMYPILSSYQKHGYHGLLKRAKKYSGAFLCDGVGLGKTYIGLMLIERLVMHDNKRVVLFVPKAARYSVWESRIQKYMPHILGGFLSFRVYNHTDLLRKGSQLRMELEQMRQQADVVIIDEAHHFRNTGIRGETEDERQSRYWEMFDICEGKQVFMLTATPVNNRLTDFQHMVELFSRGKPDHFSLAPLGVHSLPGHIRKLEKQLDKLSALRQQAEVDPEMEFSPAETNIVEADAVLRDDALFEELVVQRSRSYVKASLKEEDAQVVFPEPSDPKVVPYSVKQTYGKLLGLVEDAFHKEKPLFSLAMYYPWDFYRGKRDLSEQEVAMTLGRQRQVVRLIRTAFLKRFESSVFAFEASCRTLMKKLLAFYMTHAEARTDKNRLEKWLLRNSSVTGFNRHHSSALLGEELSVSELAEEDVVEPEFFEQAFERKLEAAEFDIPGLLADTLSDLDTIADFLRELAQFKPSQDKKLQALVQLFRGNLSGLKDVALQRHKVLVFTEFKDTATYLLGQLREAGFDSVERVDSDVLSDGRHDLIQRFAPYYNDSSTGQLLAAGKEEIRILISTDVLSEGLNIQDATRLVNYDLHWNPVRLMQRIGRIDRRLDPIIEEQMVLDHPEVGRLRGTVRYYNFLPPEELNDLLSLYKTVTHKTLRISKTFGIENGKLLRPDDDYDVLRDFVRQCDGTQSQHETMSLELERLLHDDPELEARLTRFPDRVFSGREHPSSETSAVFFCYARPARDPETGEWTVEAGDVKWYLYVLPDGRVLEEPAEIVQHIRSGRETPRVCRMERESLVQIREKLDKHITKTYLRKVQAPVGVKQVLRTWMELS